MRLLPVLLAGAAFAGGTSAYAADALKFGAPPSWVVPQAVPTNVKATDAPVALLLDDEQVALDPGKVTRYHDGAIRIQNPQGLSAAGNIALAWDPATETVTVNKLSIIRGGKVIDVLASGQTFTTLRRETNLDAATLDGTLTATIQPEDLQEGDILEFATTTERSDLVLKDHVEAGFADWNGTHIDSAHSLLSWPASMKLSLKQWPSLPMGHSFMRGGRKVLELSGHDLDPVVPPSGAPLRFQVGRVGEATDFDSWDQVSQLMLPLYRKAALIPSSGPLHDEVEKIRAASSDPKVRAAQALTLVEDRVRYVALEMGQGGYVPAPAELTWSRRFGDCKGKSVLLLAILQSLGIQSEPVLVQALAGDIVGDRLPIVGLFNHVIVRAHIGDKTYWLDGTRTGDTDLDGIEVPDFGWVLPLMANASLVHLVPPPLDLPSQERHVDIDATAGLFAPATVSIEETYRGDSAVSANTLYSSLSGQQRDEALRDNGKSYFDTFAPGSSSVQFDKAKRQLTLSMKGTAKLSWKDGWLNVPTSSIGFDPDFDRPACSNHDAPFTVSHPRFAKDIATLHLPAGVAAQEELSQPVHETLVGVEYTRTETVGGDTLTVESSERSLIPEVAYKDAVAAEAQLRSLDKNDVYIQDPATYHPTAADAAGLAGDKPESAEDYFIRAGAYIANKREDDALADLTAGLQMDSKNAWALQQRAAIYMKKRSFSDAKTDLDAALLVNPHDSILLMLQGTLADMSGNSDQALESYNKALDVDPTNWHARLSLGLVRAKKNDFDGAIQEFTLILQRNPKNVSVLAARGLSYFEKGDLESSNKDIAAAQAIDPADRFLISAKVTIASQRHDQNALISVYTAQIAINPQDGPAYFNRASAYLASGKLSLAMADCDRAVALGFKTPELRLLRANIFKMQGKNDLVAKEADLLVQENPQSDFAFVAAAKSYAALGQHEKAMRLFDQALAIKSTPLIYINRSQVRPASDLAGKMSDIDKALALLDRSPDPSFDEFWVRTERARLLNKTGHASDAEKDLAELEASAKSANEFNSLCWTKATDDILLDSALNDCQQALKLSPDTGAYLDSLGMVLLKLGRLDEAVAAYTKAIAKNVGASSLMGRAFAYLEKGDSTHAKADAGAARKLNSTIDDTFAEYGLKFDQPTTAGAKATTKTAAN